MELTALFARVNKTRFIDNAHSLIKTYLEQTASIKNSRLHIRKFYEYFEVYSSSGQNIENEEYSLKPKINEIVKKINSELNEEERMVFFLSFLELIKLDKKIESEELHFAELLSIEMHISRNDYKNSLVFILCDDSEINLEDNQDFLLISSKKNDGFDELEGSWIEQNRPHEKEKKLFLIKENLEGNILILRLQGTNYLVGRYFGDQGITLNNKRYLPGKFFLIGQFDQLKTGNDIRLTYQEIIAGFKIILPHTALRFVGEKVSTRAKGKIIRISPFNFCEEPGNMVVILCNNSTESKNISLLLAGQVPLSTGKIMLNGYNIHSDRYRVHKMIGLVPKENIFDENISIYENFSFSARLSFPGYSAAKISQLANQTISNLGLREICHIPIKKIKSGMTYEYLCILVNTGVEIIRDPFVLILDLPLEKLNSTNAEEFCQIIKSESIKGKLVFVTSTNPGSCIFKKTDRMWIFDNGGYMIYRGLASNALQYFRNSGNNLVSENEMCPVCGNINADQLYQVIHSKVIDDQGKTTHFRKKTPEEWYKLYQIKIESTEQNIESRKVIPTYSSSIPNVNLQFLAYLNKHFRSFFSNPLRSLMILTGGLLLTFLISGLLRYDWSGSFLFSRHEYLPLLFFLNTIICFITGSAIGVQFTLDDKLHIAYDHFKNYSFFSYLNVKYLLLFALAVVFSFLFTWITDYVSGISGLFIYNWLIYFSTFFIGGSIGIFFGYISRHLRNAISVTLILLILNILFSGYILPFNSLPKQLSSQKYVPAFAEIIPGRWAYEALVVQQVKDNSFQKRFFKAEQTISDLTFKTSVVIPRLQEEIFNYHNDESKPLKLGLFYKELTEINTRYPDIFQFEFLQELNKPEISSEVFMELEDYMRYIQFQLYEKLQEKLSERNELRQSIKDSLGTDNYNSFMNNNFNTPLLLFVSAKKPGKNFVEYQEEIVQTDDLIYKLPDNNFGRAHFFAPQKLMNGYYYDTTYFNLFVLWLEIFVIYILTLIFRRKQII